MTYTNYPPQSWSRWNICGLLLLTFAAWTQATTVAYCSPDLANAWAYTSSIYMSNGRCMTNCNGYAFAVLRGDDCWCSNYVPADLASTSNCNSPCPGWPDDTCGNPSQGLWAYLLIGTPQGTASGSSSIAASSTRSSSAATSASSLSSSTLSAVVPPTVTRPLPSSSSSSSSPTQVYTSIISVTGKVSTITVTPTAAQTSDSALGAGVASTSHSSGGLSGGKVAGIVVGVAIAIGLIIGFIVFFWLRKRHRKNLDAISEGASFKSSSHASKNIIGGAPSRQVSQMSSAGLLTRPTRAHTGGLSAGDDSRSAAGTTFGSDRNSTHMTVDQRLNPWAIYSNDESRASNVSLQDNQDYSRQLRVANPDSRDA